MNRGIVSSLSFGLIALAVIGLVTPTSVLPCLADHCRVAGDVDACGDSAGASEKCGASSGTHSSNSDTPADDDPCDCPPTCPAPCGFGKVPVSTVAMVTIEHTWTALPDVADANEVNPPSVGGTGIFHPPRC